MNHNRICPILENPMQLNKDILKTDLLSKEKRNTDIQNTHSFPFLSVPRTQYNPRNGSERISCKRKNKLRIKHMDNVLSYIQKCPERVINNFMVSDAGCANRTSGTCASGISCQLGGRTIWRCGCCNPNFQVTPGPDDYLYYIDAVDMAGNKKQ